MKILHTADWHVGRAIRGRSRADEHRLVLGEIVDIANREKVDLIVVAGDLFDVAAPSPEAEEIVYGALLDLADSGAPVVLIAGNHDNPRRLAAVKPLLDRTRRVYTGAFLEGPEDGGVVTLEAAGGQRVRVALFPFLSQQKIVRADELMRDSRAQHGLAYADRSAELVAHLCEGFDDSAVNLLVAHLMVSGAAAGGGEREAHISGDYCVPAVAFTHPALDYVALGHVHRMQPLSAPVSAWYCGSPLQLDFGEGEYECGVLLVEVETGVPAKVRPIPLRSGRRLRTLRGDLGRLEEEASQSGAEYLRIFVDAPPHPGLGEEVRALFPNAVDVRVAQSTEPLVDADHTLERLELRPREIFEEYLKDVGVGDDSLVALFSELLEESYEA